MGSETNETIGELFESLSQKHQKGFEESMRESEFVFDSFDLVYYKLQKISLNRGRSYIDSPELWKNKKATVNPKNNNDKCFPYPITAALNYIQIDHLERIPKIKPFIEHFNWKEIDFPSNKKD